MRLTLVAVGRRCPDWISAGVEEYRRRLPAAWRVAVTEITPVRRGKGLAKEADRIRAAVPAGARTIVLDEGGREFTTRELAQRLACLRDDGLHIAIIVGGADGLDAALIKEADECWSLSPLTLPHGLARVLVLEQIYRAWTIMSGHPYHRD